MKTQHPHARRRRALGAQIALLAMFAGLFMAFFRVQVLASSAYKLQAEENRLKRLDVPAPRGVIFDRNGRIIADNVPGYAVTILYSSRDSVMATVNRLQPFLNLSKVQIARLDQTLRRYPRQPLTVTADAGLEAAASIMERRTEYPNVYVEMRPQRRYFGGQAASHILGYIGEITGEEIGTAEFPAERYSQGAIVGKTGIEREYESILQGEPGVRFVEVDAKGRIVGDFAGSLSRPGKAGGDMRLSIDLDLQEYIDRVFPKDRMGAVVAIDPTDGSILALYSAPTFDPNEFVGGIDPNLWRHLNTDPKKPLYNRAVLGLYAPASTFKLATAAIGLELGVIKPTDHMPIPCSGGMSYGNRYWRCWKPSGHGSVDLAGAIQHSCDVYFYQLGLKIGLARLLEEGTNNIGLSRRCGIDLPEEKEGVFPAGPQFWQDRFGYMPNEGEALSLAIGQGPNSQTPLKMAQLYTALARDGSAPAPSLFTGRTDLPPGFKLKLSPDGLAVLRQGMRQVTGPGGTAYMSSLPLWDLVGKTGTGQNSLSLQGLADDHAWFGALAGPKGKPPEIVVVVLVEYGGGGSAVAAPIASKAADFYLRRKYGIPTDTVQTLREYLMLGRRPDYAFR
ncbi:MAG: penicillin-binding protein 2 [Gemmatimonadetes bacterium]|nr:penicillin-binding protein 2 [Gemmatimonadota bacterium]